MFDVDLVEDISLGNGTETLAARIKNVREAVIGAIVRHILVPLLGKDCDFHSGLRIYQCHRECRGMYTEARHGAPGGEATGL